MSYTLGENIKSGEKILLKTGWRKVVEVKEDGVIIDTGEKMLFGWEIFGWKIK